MDVGRAEKRNPAEPEGWRGLPVPRIETSGGPLGVTSEPRRLVHARLLEEQTGFMSLPDPEEPGGQPNTVGRCRCRYQLPKERPDPTTLRKPEGLGGRRVNRSRSPRRRELLMEAIREGCNNYFQDGE